MGTELKRKAVHIGAVVFALAVGRLPPVWIVLCCLGALFFNLLLLPRITGRGLERANDRARGYALGIIIYPAVLLAVSLLFFERQILLVIAWSIMAFGDGFASLIGSQLKWGGLPWNRQKSWAGLLAFLLFGGLGTCLWLWLLPKSTQAGASLETWWVAALTAVVCSGLIETVDGLVDDNLSVPLTAATVAWLVVSATNSGAGLVLPEGAWLGLIAVLLLTVLSIASRKIDVPGGVTGGILAWFMFSGMGFAGLALLFGFFILGSLASLWRYQEKERLGVAQENKGRRSVPHALSNGGVAAACGLMAWLTAEQLWVVMLAASLASAAADTLSAEFGTIYGRRFIDLASLKSGTRGADGVISLEGSLAGVLGALFIAVIFGLFEGFHSTFFLVALAGIAGNLMDSLLGATLQRRGYMNNHTVNFANTLFAAITAGIVFRFIQHFS